MLQAVALGREEIPFKGYKLPWLFGVANKLLVLAVGDKFIDNDNPSKKGKMLEFKGDQLAKLVFKTVMKDSTTEIMKEI